MATTIYFGQCKWFNNKSGYGFLSMSETNDLANPNKDIFVHYTNILPKDSNSYKALQSGEYVQFNISDCNNKSTTEEKTEENEENNEETNILENIREQAVNVTGIHGGKLLNEYRNSIAKEINGEDGPPRGYGFQGKGNMYKGKGKGKGKGFYGGRGRGGGMRRFGGIPPPHNPNQKEEWTPSK